MNDDVFGFVFKKEMEANKTKVYMDYKIFERQIKELMIEVRLLDVAV